MTLVHFWKGGSKLKIINEEDLPKSFKKIVNLGNQLFLLDNRNRIWLGTITSNEIAFTKSKVNAVDIAATPHSFYYVSESGKVFKTNSDVESSVEIILHEEATCCVHGYATSSHKTLVSKIAAGGMGVLFISDTGELWACGEHPQLGITAAEQPKKICFFEGKHITGVGCGEDFNIVVAHKRDEICPVINENGEVEVFLSNCPQCANEAMSPLSPQSYSESCPLGLQLGRSNESLSVSTSTSKNSGSGDNKKSNDNTSSCTEEDSPHISDNIECSLPNLEDRDRAEYEKETRGSNILLINTEAARQFLTRQLSWVSTGGEELLAEVTGPTKMIRRNVSTVASLVYERVKTVGDKVATLSRHVSGGSDNNSESFEEFEELTKSNASLNRNFRWDWSYSDGSEEAIAERNGNCINKGSHLIRGEVWAWGSSQYGQLGIGDEIRRHKPVLVGSVSHIGVTGVWCGKKHCIIQTLDGRVFGWGSNEQGQLSYDSKIVTQSSPMLCEKALAVAVGDYHSVILTRNEVLLWLSQPKQNPIIDNGFDFINENKNPQIIILSTSDITCFVLTDITREATLETDLAHVQSFLEELLTVHNTIVKPLSRRSSLEDTISNLCFRYNDVLHLTAVIVSNLLEGRSSCEVLSEIQDDLIYIYEAYLTTVCDVIAINGFAQITRAVDTPLKITACFSDRLPTRKTSSESIITCAFSQPLSHISIYKGMISRGGGDCRRMEKLRESQEMMRKEAELTKAFWDSAGGRIPEMLRTPQRRIIKESRSSPLTLYNASRFSSHWFILLSDSFVHISGTSHQIHSLDTVWVETNNLDSEQIQNVILFVTPEESLTLVTTNHTEKVDWLQAFQTTIKTFLNKPVIPISRSASYTFTKHPMYKDAKYTGKWHLGKMDGKGKLEWPDGRAYTGQFRNNLCHGTGKMEIPDVSVYEGQWRDGFQNGYGITKYENGDVYIGYYKDGFENGHGVRKTGRFTSSQASVYVGEWLIGQKHGYGVLNNICTGEKYMGLWTGNLKNGSGLSVTLDGIYYEGTFVQDVLTGRGVMVFEDGTHYEGELREAGVFSGKGTLTFSSGDTFEGSLHGTWNDGVKISGTLHKHLASTSPRHSFSKPVSFGLLCVPAEQKWKSIFRQCWSSLGVSGEGKPNETHQAWQNIATILGSRHGAKHHELLQVILTCGRTDLNLADYKQIIAYLQLAFENNYHPLGRALAELIEAYITTYGGMLVHPLLLPQAVAELRSITQRLYQVVRVLFPALPYQSSQIVLGDEHHEVASMSGLLYPLILPKLYSSLLFLYSLHNRKENDAYWKRLLKWNRQPDITLMAFLGVDKKFWQKGDGTPLEEGLFVNAVESLQQLKTTFSPMEKLIVIHTTFKEITKAVQGKLGETFTWQMDDLFPVFHYVVVRSHIQELGSEILFIEDFIEDRFKNGEMDIMFTTLKACYFQILQEKININI
ncbi:alsin [Cimex lectularius]|uniref:VPS9 domain-containing protein n=1 Tax=Cimex lectularius TaxID=79782 RepID=A0A8I6RUJ6_CIMLE|nr:alsin [Cimex lectularius]